MSSTTTTPKAEAQPRIALIFIALMLTMFLASLSQMVLSSAQPTIVGELNGVELLSWISAAYLLASTVTMPIYGKISDVFGRKPLIIIAILLFVAGSVVGGLATDMEILIAGRAIQGLGGGGLMILSQAAIADVVPARERGKYMGLLGAVFAVSSVAGPLLGGWFTDGPGWRWAFWMNLPLGVLALLAVIFYLHTPKAQADRGRPDIFGMMFMAAATTGIVLIVTWGGNTLKWDSAEILWLIVGTVASVILFVFAESKAQEPIIPLMMFKDRNFNLTTIAAPLTAVAMFGAIGYMPLYFQMALGESAVAAGLLMVPMMAALLITSVVSGIVVSRTGRYKLMPVVGTFILAGGLYLMGTITLETEVWLICTFMALVGIGLGMSMQILTLIVQNSFSNKMVGTATASNNYFRQVGGTIGTAVVGSMFVTRLHEQIAANLPAAAASAAGSKIGSLTPDVIRHLPDALRIPITLSFNEALIPLYTMLIPITLVAAVVLMFIKFKPLSTVVEHEVMPEALAEGQLLITEED